MGLVCLHDILSFIPWQWITASGITLKKAAKVVFWCHFLRCCHSNGLIFQYHPTHFYHWCFFPMWHSNRFIYIVSKGLISNKNCNLCSFSINHCHGCYGNKIKIRRLKMPYPDSPCLVLYSPYISLISITGQKMTLKWLYTWLSCLFWMLYIDMVSIATHDYSQT